jgi:hypothetical protein
MCVIVVQAKIQINGRARRLFSGCLYVGGAAALSAEQSKRNRQQGIVIEEGA